MNEIGRKGKCGRKLKYEKPEDMSKAIDEYFKDCAGQIATDENNNAILNKYGQPVIVNAHPPTVTGLALWLGFKTRQSLLDYQALSRKFDDIITIAKSRCEEYAESRLYDREGVNGAKFSLINNFKGWSNDPKKSDEDDSTSPESFIDALSDSAEEVWDK